MTQVLALTAAGSVLITACVYLLLPRMDVAGRRPILALTRRWVAASDLASALVLAALLGSAISSFALVSRYDPNASFQLARETPDAPAGHPVIEYSEELAALRAYADGLDGVLPGPPAKAAPREVPGVEQMIDNLVQRLKSEPGNVRGWKMLGWSYLNTGRPDEAMQAYQAAFRLAPSDKEITAALEAVRAARPPQAKAGTGSR